MDVTYREAREPFARCPMPNVKQAVVDHLGPRASVHRVPQSYPHQHTHTYLRSTSQVCSPAVTLML